MDNILICFLVTLLFPPIQDMCECVEHTYTKHNDSLYMCVQCEKQPGHCYNDMENSREMLLILDVMNTECIL